MRRASSPTTLAVVGAGAWGTVIACLLARNGHEVRLWSRNPEAALAMNDERENSKRLPGVTLPEGISIGSDLEAALAGAQAAFVAVPSVGIAAIAPMLSGCSRIISCSKGLVSPGLTRLSTLLARRSPSARLAVLSGPNLAGEIAAGLPAAAVAASHEPELAAEVQDWLQSSRFRVYTSPDPVGVEVGGALKNVIALAAGMAQGLQLGENAKASILTRGLAELVRVGLELGGRRETIYGLSGLGDMVATCSSAGSRNRRAGERLAGGAKLEELQREGLTAEGIPTVRTVEAFSHRKELSLPICEEVYRVVFRGKSPVEALEDLMGRASRPEW